MSVKLLTEHHLEFLSLKGGCRCSSESTLVKMPYCWKSHVTAHILFLVVYFLNSGVNMYAMLTGNLPFTVEPFNIKALHNKMINSQMNPLPDCVTRGNITLKLHTL